MVTYLKRTAFNQIKLFLKDYIRNYNSRIDNKKLKTINLIDNIDNFAKQLEENFEDIKEERTAERVLKQI